MQFQKIDSTYIVRMDVGEEIIATLTQLCKDETIALAEVSAIGAVSRASVGRFNREERRYQGVTLEGHYELVHLTGNVSRKDGEVYVHLHAAFSDDSGRMFGGHLSEAVISATCEMFLTTIAGEIGRRVCEKTGLNILDL